jgi:serine phosphatase RsbU (regulator of sigma subunit)
MCAAESPPLASLLVARYSPAAGTIEWASAGHLAPIVIRHGAGEVLDPAAGPALGLMPGAEFPGGTVAVRPGDVWLSYTDGLIAHEAAEPLRELASRLAGAAASGGLPALLDIAPGATADDACLLAIEMTA